MRGYKALLTQCELHNHKEMIRLKDRKLSFDKLCQKLQRIDQNIGSNIECLKNQLDYVEENSTKLVQNMQKEVHSYLNSDELYRCGCGFKTLDSEIYLTHLKDDHASLKYVQGSSHFMTLFGNLLKYNQKFEEIFKHIPKKQKEEVSQLISPENTKVKLRSTKKFSNAEQLKKTKAPGNRQVLASSEQFFCGECSKTMDHFRNYTLHMRAHDYIINPNSSHIIIRNGKQTQSMTIRGEQNSKQRYNCHCNAAKNFSRQEFVAHVLKWHKGIAPRK